MISIFNPLPVLLAALVLLGGPAHADDAPKIYVSDFEVDVKPAEPKDSDDDDDDGVFPRGPVRGILGRLRGGDEDPQAQADKMVDAMAEKLVAELKDEGFDAQRLAPGGPAPASGWLVKGVFTQADEGKRIRRAVIGFGAGKTEIQAYATLQDLSKPDEPLYRIDDSGQKGNMPGAILLMNPYVAAAKFVMSKNDLEKSVKKAANEIAEDILKKLKPEQGT